MPTYVYRCPSCEIQVEERRKMSQADEPLDCPLCGERLVRGITSFMFSKGRSTAVSPADKPSPSTHSASCPCCYPVRRR